METRQTITNTQRNSRATQPQNARGLTSSCLQPVPRRHPSPVPTVRALSFRLAGTSASVPECRQKRCSQSRCFAWQVPSAADHALSEPSSDMFTEKWVTETRILGLCALKATHLCDEDTCTAASESQPRHGQVCRVKEPDTCRPTPSGRHLPNVRLMGSWVQRFKGTSH